jgi:hypothetical protein
MASGETGAEDSPVIVNFGHGDAIVFSDENESVPSLEDDTSDEEEDDDVTVDSDEEDEEDDVDEELEEGLAERLRILADARALKNLAVAFLHPEKPVQVNPVEYGRNFFDRPSAPERKEDEDADEEAEILEDMIQLKKAARAYLHPEDHVAMEDSTMFGRNYFNRPSAPEVEDAEDAMERARVLAEASLLKKAAAGYMHPEVGVKSTDGAAFGRNYFNRFSAPETEEDEYADERAEILEEAAALKKLASDYMHPEVGVSVEDSTLFGRNYFNRPSAPEADEDANERALVLAEAAALKKAATSYMHPEVGVTSTDGTAFGRNYFNRFSAPQLEVMPAPAPERKESGDVAAVNNLAKAVKGANLPSTKNSKLSSLDKDVGSKKSASSVNLFGLSEDVF